MGNSADESPDTDAWRGSVTEQRPKLALRPSEATRKARRRVRLQSILPAAGVALGASATAIDGSLWPILVAVGCVAVATACLYAYVARRLTTEDLRARLQGRDGALYVSAATLLDDRRPWAWGARPVGRVEIMTDEIAWWPGRRASRRGVGPVRITRERIRTLELAPYWGVGTRDGFQVLVDEGSAVGFFCASQGRAADALAMFVRGTGSQSAGTTMNRLGENSSPTPGKGRFRGTVR